MRAKFFLTLCLFFALSNTSQAQKDGIEEKVNTVLAKFESTIKPDKSKKSSLENIFTDFYTAQEKLRNNIQGRSSTLAQGLQQDYQSVRKKSEALFTDRDNKLKKLLNGEEYKKWKEHIEPSTRSRGK